MSKILKTYIPLFKNLCNFVETRFFSPNNLKEIIDKELIGKILFYKIRNIILFSQFLVTILIPSIGYIALIAQ